MPIENEAEVEQRIKKRIKDSPITKATRFGNWLSVITIGAAFVIPAAAVGLGYDILGNVAGNEIKERNDRRIANAERSRSGLAAVRQEAMANPPGGNTSPLPKAA
jgi:hypothetical protein